MRCWRPPIADDDSHMVYQIVLPSGYHAQVLRLAHEHVYSGHLGVTKTYQCLSKHLFWPGVKSAVSTFVKAFHVCQLAGKPNQTIPQAPLQPIPVMGEPFERRLIVWDHYPSLCLAINTFLLLSVQPPAILRPFHCVPSRLKQ